MTVHECPIWLDQTVGLRHHGDGMGKDIDDWSEYRIFFRGSIRTMTRLPAAHRGLMDLHFAVEIKTRIHHFAVENHDISKYPPIVSH